MRQAPPNRIEGHARFCRDCGHDLPGLSGGWCPRCGQTSRLVPVARSRKPGATGRWLVVGVLGAGVALALIGLKYRKFEPPPGPEPVPTPASQPATRSDLP